MNKYKLGQRVKVIANTYEADPHLLVIGSEGVIDRLPLQDCFICGTRYRIKCDVKGIEFQFCAEEDLESI